jgi:adenylyl-sulfate kinase
MHREQAGSLGLNEIGRVVFTAARNIFYDPYGKNKATGSFIVIDRITNNTIAAGMILDREPEDSLPAKIKPVKDGRDYELPDYSMISAEDKARRFGQKPVTLWFTGLASSGKREIAFRVEKELFDRGYASVVLDAGSVRARLNRELDFTEGGRAENLRRVAEMSRILNNNGLISLCAFVSPSAGVREQIAEIIAKERFLEIFVDASLEFCGKRDKNGFYEKAGREQISSFTGINAPYDRPENPGLTLNMDEIPLGKAVEKVMALLEEKEIIGGNKK